MRRMILAVLLLLPMIALAQATRVNYYPFDSPPRWVVVEFVQTPAQMATLFTTRYEIEPAASGVYRVPRLIVIYKASGDAYTVPGTSDIQIQSAAAGIWVQVETTGFLDQTGAKSRAYIMPSTAAGAFYALVGSDAAHDGFFLTITTANITQGASSPNVKFRLYYEEYSMTW